MNGLVLRGGEVDGRPADVRVADGRVAAVAPDLPPDPGDEAIDVVGAVRPGLHDHHLHLRAMAAADASVDLSGGDLAPLRAVARAGGWVRAVGWPGDDLDRAAVDAVVGPVPVRVQHASGALWVLNSAALEAIGPVPAVVAESGRVFREDEALAARWPRMEGDLAAVARRLLAQGVTGVTDATPVTTTEGLDELAALPLRVVVTGAPSLGPVLPGVTLGPAKVVIGDHDLPDPRDLAALIQQAHGAGRPVAVHCVTAEALALLLAAWAEVGARPGDRVEHGAVVPPDAIPVLARLGVTVVTQPGFVAARGDRYLAEVDEVDRPDLWRCASLLAGGVRVAAGTDAPFGPEDPWRAIAAAADRRTPAGAVLGPEEALPADRALDLFLGPWDDPGGPPRRVEPGAVADLCVHDGAIALTLIGGTVV